MTIRFPVCIVTGAPWGAARSPRDSSLSIPCRVAARGPRRQLVIPSGKLLVAGNGRSRAEAWREPPPLDGLLTLRFFLFPAKASPIDNARFRSRGGRQPQRKTVPRLEPACPAACRH